MRRVSVSIGPFLVLHLFNSLDLLQKDAFDELLELFREGESFVDPHHSFLKFLPELMDVPLRNELEEGISRTMFLVEGHHGSQHANEDLPA